MLTIPPLLLSTRSSQDNFRNPQDLKNTYSVYFPFRYLPKSPRSHPPTVCPAPSPRVPLSLRWTLNFRWSGRIQDKNGDTVPTVRFCSIEKQIPQSHVSQPPFWCLNSSYSLCGGGGGGAQLSSEEPITPLKFSDSAGGLDPSHLPRSNPNAIHCFHLEV